MNLGYVWVSDKALKDDRTEEAPCARQNDP